MLLLDHNGVKPETNSKKNYRNWRIHGEWKKKKNKTSGHWQKSKKLIKFFKLNENEIRKYNPLYETEYESSLLLLNKWH